MSQELIKQILNIPEESQEIEFKRLGEESVVKKITETVIAMSNTFGGSVIIGVDDPEKTKLKDHARIFGIEENKDIYDAVGRELMKIIPPLSGIWPPQIVKDDITGKEIAIVRIPKSIDGFRSINNDVYVRQQKSNRRLSVHEITSFEYAKGFKKSDNELVNVDMSLLETRVYLDWKNTRNIKGNIEELLEKTGLARKNSDEILKPTRAAVLLFAEFPTSLCSIFTMSLAILFVIYLLSSRYLFIFSHSVCLNSFRSTTLIASCK